MTRKQRSAPRLDRRRHYSPSIVARWLDVHQATVLLWIRRGLLPAMNIGAGKVPHYIIFRTDLDEFMAARGASAAHRQTILGQRRPT